MERAKESVVCKGTINVQNQIDFLPLCALTGGLSRQAACPSVPDSRACGAGDKEGGCEVHVVVN